MRILILVWTVFTLSACAAPQTIDPSANLSALPEIKLAVPQDEHLQSYLGVFGEDTFSVNQIGADIVIIKLFSVHCPLCHKGAKNLNYLHTKIENSAELKGRIKLIAIGLGDSDVEIVHFAARYRLKVPVFADPDSDIHKKLGRVKYPYHVGVRIDSEDSTRIIYARPGGIRDNDRFLEQIVRLAAKS